MLTLAVDTSSPVGSVALLRDGHPLAERTTSSQAASPRTKSATHSTNLVPAIEKLFSDLDLQITNCDLLAVGLGPGSFTGIRVAIATLKGFALVANKPIVGVSSMDALALGAKERLPAPCSSLAVIVDAGRGEVYCSVYSMLEGQFFKVNEAAIFTLPRLAAGLLTPTFFVGPQIHNYRAQLEQILSKRACVDSQPTTPAAHLVGLLAEEKFSDQKAGDVDLEPIYLRPPVQPPRGHG